MILTRVKNSLMGSLFLTYSSWIFFLIAADLYFLASAAVML